MTKSHRASEKTNQPVDAPTHLHGKRDSSTQQQQQQLRTTRPTSALAPLSTLRRALRLRTQRSTGWVSLRRGVFWAVHSCVCVCVCVSTPAHLLSRFFFGSSITSLYHTRRR